jgi:hypothetical protein
MNAVMDQGHVYLFFGENRKRMKILVYDGSGLVLIAKRNERGRFMADNELMGRNEITHEELKLIRRSLCGRSKEKRVDASDRPRTPSQSENLIFSQAMFPTNEVRNESGQTTKNRWAELDSQEIEVPVHDSEFEEEGRVRGIEKHRLEKWSDLWKEIPNAFDKNNQIEILEQVSSRRFSKRKNTN